MHNYFYKNLKSENISKRQLVAPVKLNKSNISSINNNIVLFNIPALAASNKKFYARNTIFRISNNGDNFSQPITLWTYDSTCHSLINGSVINGSAINGSVILNVKLKL